MYRYQRNHFHLNHQPVPMNRSTQRCSSQNWLPSLLTTIGLKSRTEEGSLSHLPQSTASWWFQPVWNIFSSQIDHFPKYTRNGKTKKHKHNTLKPPSQQNHCLEMVNYQKVRVLLASDFAKFSSQFGCLQRVDRCFFVFCFTYTFLGLL